MIQSILKIKAPSHLHSLSDLTESSQIYNNHNFRMSVVGWKKILAT